ncbi:SRPBCC domain-containing protein [Kribbella sp. NPDC054772]
MATREHRVRATGTDRSPQLRYIKTLDCDAERLWTLMTKPELLSEWLGATIFSDTQYGGFTVTTGAGTQRTGLVTACVPQHYVQLAWDDPPHAPSTVIADVVPGTHDAHLILTHGGLARELVAGYRVFWTGALERLTQYVAGRLPKRAPSPWQLPGSAGGS